MQQLKQIDHVIQRLFAIRNTIALHPDIEFDIGHLLPVVETAVNAVAEEIDDEMKP